LKGLKSNGFFAKGNNIFCDLLNLLPHKGTWPVYPIPVASSNIFLWEYLFRQLNRHFILIDARLADSISVSKAILWVIFE